MSCCISGDGKMRIPPPSTSHHISNKTLNGTQCAASIFGDPTEVPVNRHAQNYAGRSGLLTMPVKAGFRDCGADTRPVTASTHGPERERLTNLSLTYAGDYGGKNTLWPGTKGPTYTFTPKHQVEFFGHKVSDNYTQRAPDGDANPANYRAWSTTSRETYKNPMEVGATLRAASRPGRPSTAVYRRSQYMHRLGNPPNEF